MPQTDEEHQQHIDTEDEILRGIEEELTAIHEGQQQCRLWAELHRRNLRRFLDAAYRLAPKLQPVLLAKQSLSEALIVAAGKAETNPTATIDWLSLDGRLLAIDSKSCFRKEISESAANCLLDVISRWLCRSVELEASQQTQQMHPSSFHQYQQNLIAYQQPQLKPQLTIQTDGNRQPADEAVEVNTVDSDEAPAMTNDGPPRASAGALQRKTATVNVVEGATSGHRIELTSDNFCKQGLFLLSEIAYTFPQVLQATSRRPHVRALLCHVENMADTASIPQRLGITSDDIAPLVAEIKRLSGVR